jgi:hypothetical protein
VRRYPPLQGRTWRGRPNGGSTRAWRNQRARILARDGYRCTAIEDGERCAITAPAPLEVHHLNPGQGPTADDHELATVCRHHHCRARYGA